MGVPGVHISHMMPESSWKRVVASSYASHILIRKNLLGGQEVLANARQVHHTKCTAADLRLEDELSLRNATRPVLECPKQLGELYQVLISIRQTRRVEGSPRAHGLLGARARA